jgi:hypothetical protein
MQTSEIITLYDLNQQFMKDRFATLHEKGGPEGYYP